VKHLLPCRAVCTDRTETDRQELLLEGDGWRTIDGGGLGIDANNSLMHALHRTELKGAARRKAKERNTGRGRGRAGRHRQGMHA
jgi:hypothetical protein